MSQNNLIPIGKAAEMLGVSIDTVRRWDKSGKITSTRPDGKNRYFSIEDIAVLNGNESVNSKEVVSTMQSSQASSVATPTVKMALVSFAFALFVSLAFLNTIGDKNAKILGVETVNISENPCDISI